MPPPPGTPVLHVDVDQFLVALARRADPRLEGRPVVVGGTGDPTVPRTVCMCASYEARERGVRAGTPLRTAARRLPDAVYLPYDERSCAEGSAQVMAALRELGEVEVLGWEEAFLVPRDAAGPLGERVRRHVRERTGLVCSVGVGDTPLQAKTATGFGKPAGVGTLSWATWLDVMGDRPTDALWGVGPRSAAHLAELGIATVGQLAAADPDALVSRFGRTVGPRLLAAGRGGEARDLVTEPRKPVSRGRQKTYPVDLGSADEVAAELELLAREVAAEVLGAGHTVAEVGVTVRTETFWECTRTRRVTPATTDPEDVVAAAAVALGRVEIRRPVRLLGVRLVFG